MTFDRILKKDGFGIYERFVLKMFFKERKEKIMSLKFRYASMFFAVLIILAFGVYESLVFMQNGMYWQLAILAVALYGGMYFCGKKMTSVFVTLSMISFLRKQGGVVDEMTCTDFVARSLPKKSETAQKEIWRLVKKRLMADEVIIVKNKKICLVG